jgi:hypothetical protein
MATAEELLAWRTNLEFEYVLICKFCSRKVIDPDKTSQQIFTKSKCPHCNQSKDQQKVKQKFRVAC